MESFFAKMTWPDRGPGLRGHGEHGPYLSVIVPMLLYSGACDYAGQHSHLLDRYPLSGTGFTRLHLTVQTVHQLTTQLQAVEAGRALRKDVTRQMRPFTVELGPARLGVTAVTAAVYPEDSFRVLYTLVRDALESVEGVTLRPAEARFWPHVTLGYATREFDGDVLNGELRELRPDRPLVIIDRVHLVEMIQEPAAAVPYHWKLLQEFTFEQDPVPAPADTEQTLAAALLLMADRAHVNDGHWLASPALETARNVLGVPTTGRATHQELWHQPDRFKVAAAFLEPGGASRYTLLANGMTGQSYKAEVDQAGTLSVTLPNGLPVQNPDEPPYRELYDGIRAAIRRHQHPDYIDDET